MKKIPIIIGLVLGFLWSTFAISNGQELGEFCWQEDNGGCILRLQVAQHGSYLSFIGKEVCFEGGIIDEEKNAYGSGYIDNNQVKIGLTYVGMDDPSEPNANLWHEGKKFLVNLTDLSLTQYWQSNDPQECGSKPIPCIIEDHYNLIPCP